MHGANLPAAIRFDYPPIDTQRIVYLSEDNLRAKIIFYGCNSTSYLILMLGTVGYSPVVSPHRIKQVCKPYRVVKVAAEWRSVGSLDQ